MTVTLIPPEGRYKAADEFRKYRETFGPCIMGPCAEIGFTTFSNWKDRLKFWRKIGPAFKDGEYVGNFPDRRSFKMAFESVFLADGLSSR